MPLVSRDTKGVPAPTRARGATGQRFKVIKSFLVPVSARDRPAPPPRSQSHRWRRIGRVIADSAKLPFPRLLPEQSLRRIQAHLRSPCSATPPTTGRISSGSVSHPTPTPARFHLRDSIDPPDPEVMFGGERTERRPRASWMDAPRWEGQRNSSTPIRGSRRNSSPIPAHLPDEIGRPSGTSASRRISSPGTSPPGQSAARNRRPGDRQRDRTGDHPRRRPGLRGGED